MLASVTTGPLPFRAQATGDLAAAPCAPPRDAVRGQLSASGMARSLRRVAAHVTTRPKPRSRPSRSRPEAACPIRPGEPCSLCFPGATGPQDCGLVYLVGDDEELAAELNTRRADVNRRRREEREARSA